MSNDGLIKPAAESPQMADAGEGWFFARVRRLRSSTPSEKAMAK
jgi:hypothetical protein